MKESTARAAPSSSPAVRCSCPSPVSTCSIAAQCSRAARWRACRGGARGGRVVYGGGALGRDGAVPAQARRRAAPRKRRAGARGAPPPQRAACRRRPRAAAVAGELRARRMRAARRVDPRGARRARCAGARLRRSPRTRDSAAHHSTRRCCRLRAVELRPRGDTRRPGTLAMTARTATVTRATRETSITVTLTLEGTGKADVKTGLGFLDHLLEALIRHARFDVTLASRGDLHVDDHHTAEDCALALGQALDRALGERRGRDPVRWADAPPQ